MANEITITASLSFNKPLVTNGTVGKSVNNLQINVSGTVYHEGAMLVPTSETTIPIGSLTTPGWAVITNLDPTNYVQIYCVTGQKGVKLLPGETAFFPFDDSGTPYAKANTASVQIEFLIISR
jgi:hypothetical protein